jgi:hypothetical protein
MIIRFRYLCFIFTSTFWILSFGIGFSQHETSLVFSDTSISMDQFFQIELHVTGDKIKTISNFPEIDDFMKTTTSFVKKEKNKFVVTQLYKPRKSGQFILPPFYLSINGIKYKYTGIWIKVSNAKVAGNSADQEVEDTHYIEPEIDAFFSVTADKKSIYSGEGFTLTAAFLIARDNTAEFNFIDLKSQVDHLIKKVKPAQCWVEELNNASELEMDSILLHGKKYTRYLIYSGIFYPLSIKEIRIPSLEFKLLKYKIKKNPSLIQRKEHYEILSSNAFIIKIQDLPQHPLKDQVPAGVFHLHEKLIPPHPRAGSSLKYIFSIRSVQGVSTIAAPIITDLPEMEVFPPHITIQQTKLSEAKIKNFEYTIICKKPGRYPLRGNFKWIYFNVKTQEYDTLFPRLSINVKASVNPGAEVVMRPGFYTEMIGKVNNKIKSQEKIETIKRISNIAILCMLLFTIILIFKE